jgi:peptide-methionine (S)-S-oxide reductase
MRLFYRMIMGLLLIVLFGIVSGGDEPMTIHESKTIQQDLETATLGGGCFWCLEPLFEELKGVQKVEVGYAGGHVSDPTYEQVCTGNTGHAEVAQITFDPKVISYEELLHVFFTIHDPTTLNRQGTDSGAQYRSIILTHSDAQRRIAENVIHEIEAARVWQNPIVTEIVPLTTYYKAEGYHQSYFENNTSQPYCRMVIAPKLDKFRKENKSVLDE